MMQAVIAVVALLAGILLGFIIRANSAKSEKALLEKQISANAEALAALQGKLAQSQAESAARAGFEPLAAEREKTIAQLRAESDNLRSEIAAKAATASTHAARISQLEAELEAERKNLAEKLALLDTAKKTLADQFHTLAADILDQKSKTFSEASQKELQPLRDQIKDFREKVEKVQVDSATGVTELKTLIDKLGSLNQALTEEAHNLATALRRDTKAQGNWGETILRNILDKSGLEEGLQYTFQQSFVEVSEDGETSRRQTDVVVKLPGGRHLIIDSKVSLNAYSDSVNADDDKARTDAIKRHLASVRSHLNELSGRNYQSLPGMQSPDFVVMFVPIEPAFLLALQNDETIWLDGYQKRVLVCGPTTVLFVIGIVADLWRQERQASSVREVMDQGAKLYVKFAAFINDMDDLGKSLRDASQGYEDAKKKLSEGRGNLVDGMEKLRKLGLKPKFSKSAKPIPVDWLASATEEDEILTLAASSEEVPAEAEDPPETQS